MNRIIIGDIHSCAKELREVIQLNPNCEYIAVGDLFDRGVKGMEVWDLIHEYNIQCCLGNHELKMLEYLRGERKYLPKHYMPFIDAFYHRSGGWQQLREFLHHMPLMIKLDENSLVTHGGVLPDNPWQANVSANVYGRFDPEKPMPHGEDDPNAWWNSYTQPTLVYYGHISFSTPRLGFTPDGQLNSVGMDTGACHGGSLSAICHETKEVTCVPSKDYFSELKRQLY